MQKELLNINNYDCDVVLHIQMFVKGELSIADFVAKGKENRKIYDCLDQIVDTIAIHHIPVKRRTVFMKNVNQNKPFEMRSYVEQFIKELAQDFRDLSDDWKNNPPKVSEFLNSLKYLTAHGAFVFFSIVSDVYYQVDSLLERTEKYEKEYEFLLDVLPRYIGGVAAEGYISEHILSKYPDSMKKTERKRLVKEEIKLAFPNKTKRTPRWIQEPEWPISMDNKPMIYVGQKAFDNYSEYYFTDANTGELHTVTQWW